MITLILGFRDWDDSDARGCVAALVTDPEAAMRFMDIGAERLRSRFSRVEIDTDSIAFCQDHADGTSNEIRFYFDGTAEAFAASGKIFPRALVAI